MHNHGSHHLGLVLVHIMRRARALPEADMRVLRLQAVRVGGRIDAPHGWVACEDDELGRGELGWGGDEGVRQIALVDFLACLAVTH